MKKALLLFAIPMATVGYTQCADEANVHAFTFDGTNYEIIRETKTWTDAAACAVEHGGFLARIDFEDENTVLFDEITTAGVVADETVAPDGGGGAYLWIGGTDKFEEGKWIWDGDNNDSGDQFWDGNFDGGPVGGLYNNWGSSEFGSEPDDFGSGQDGAGLSVDGWPLGSAGQWNDVSADNELYFIVELGEEPDNSSIDEENSGPVSIYPNPSADYIFIEIKNQTQLSEIQILNTAGNVVYRSTQLEENKIDIRTFAPGVYIIDLELTDGSHITQKVVK